MRAFARLSFVLAALLIGQSFAEEGETYALLVGVGTYTAKSGLNTLTYSESDMSALATALKVIGVKDQNVRLMIQSAVGDDRFKPRRENIETELRLLLKNKGPEDSVVIAFAGHGLQYRDKPDSLYFCPSDANIDDSASWVDLKAVFEDLKKSGAGSKLLISDCCRNDPRSRGRRALPNDVQSITRIPKLTAPSVGALFSCSTDEFAHEEDEFKGGVFTHFLIRGIKEKSAATGQVEVAALMKYLRKSVYDYVTSKYGVEQNPVFFLEENKPLMLGKLRKPGELPRTPSNAVTVEATGNDLTLDLGGGVKVELVRVEAGEFLMGADDSDANDSEKPVHTVKITKPYCVGKYPITVAQFRHFVNATSYRTEAEQKGEGYTVSNGKWGLTKGASWKNPGFAQDDDHPVVLVTKNDAQEFIKWACTQSGRSVSLPTEAQWEHVARGPKAFKYPWGNAWDGTKANHADLTLKNTGKAPDTWTYSNDRDGFAFTSPVGQFKNASWCGAFDMSGNVGQWCQDAYDSKFYANSKTSDPVNDTQGAVRVLRGGSWNSNPQQCRSSYRNGYPAGSQNSLIGFRVAVAASSKTP